MIILGIETSTQICSAALVQKDKLLSEYRLNIKNIHAKKLAEMIDFLWQDTGLGASQLDGIAVSIGPGSFTGLRIGLSMAKGIALSHDIPITAVGTLAGIAEQAPIKDGLVCPMIRSRADEYYAALFQRTQFQNKIIHDVKVLTTAELGTFAQPGSLILLNQAHKEQLSESYKDYIWAPHDFCYASAYSIAQLGYRQLKTGQTENVGTMEPLYYQEFIAGKPKSLNLLSRDETTKKES